jgi:hypothetical protein
MRLITEDDWDFTWRDVTGEVNAAIIFKHENDALAFKLKFGL